MQRRKPTEEETYRTLRRWAMDRSQKMEQVAQDFLRTVWHGVRVLQAGDRHPAGAVRPSAGLMRHFPTFLDLSGRTVLLVGEGEIIDSKAEPVIGADAPEEDLLALSAEAQRRGIPVNIVDRAARCEADFRRQGTRPPLPAAGGDQCAADRPCTAGQARGAAEWRGPLHLRPGWGGSGGGHPLSGRAGHHGGAGLRGGCRHSTDASEPGARRDLRHRPSTGRPAGPGYRGAGAGPAAIVERGGTAAVRIGRGTLGTLGETAAALGVQGPALVIIGDVVGQAHAAALGGRDTSQPPVALT